MLSYKMTFSKLPFIYSIFTCQG